MPSSLNDDAREPLYGPGGAEDYSRDEFEALSSFDEDAYGADAVYSGWDNVPVIDPMSVDEGPANEEYVYGLGMTKPESERDEVARGVRAPVSPMIMGALAVALIGGGTAAIWKLGLPVSADRKVEIVKPVEEDEDKIEKQEAKKEEKSYTIDDIRDYITKSFSYEGQGITIESSRVSVETINGHVLVTHQLTEHDVPQAEHIVRRAGLRANVLASYLTNKLLVGGGETPVKFVDLTWVVRDPEGEAYVAVRELPGNLRTSSQTYGVIAGAKGYSISPSILSELGEGTGLSEKNGTAPTDLEGNVIETTASIHKDEPEEEQNTQAQSTPNTSSNSSNSSSSNSSSRNTNYYYDDSDDYYDDYYDGGGDTGGGDTGGDTGRRRHRRR